MLLNVMGACGRPGAWCGSMKARGRRSGAQLAKAIPTAPTAQLGNKLRRMRRAGRLTMREVADRAGCSESLISKIETGKALPSLSNLHSIVAVLGCNISTLFEPSGAPPDQIWKAHGRPVIAMGKNAVALEQLVAQTPGRLLEANVHIVRPGAGSEGSLRHDGEEIGYVLAGTIELTIDGHTHLLSEGDSFAFRSNLSHSYRNRGRRTARIIWVNTPPTF